MPQRNVKDRLAGVVRKLGWFVGGAQDDMQYRDILVNVVEEYGEDKIKMICEVQLTLSMFHEARKRLHRVYKFVRASNVHEYRKAAMVQLIGKGKWYEYQN